MRHDLKRDRGTPRDYKVRAAPRSRSRGGLLLGLLIGFLLGIGVAAAIAVYFFKTPVPFLDRGRPADRPSMGQNLAEAPKAAKTADGKPRFDFYRILPGQEEPITEKQLREAAKQPEKATIKELYLLQAGSFQNPADADNLKARLALMGLEASVEPTSLPEKGTWYRVRLGPYAAIDEINRVRKTMAEGGIEPALVRIKDEAPKH